MKAIYLNLDHRKDRKRRVEKQFRENGLKVERFAAIEHSNPQTSFNQSQKAILQSITETTIVFEDDVEFINMDKWDKVINLIPEDFDFAYLSGNPQRELYIKVNDYWWRAFDVWTTHAVIYTKEGAEKILSILDDTEMYDTWLGRVGQYCLNSYICNPFLCIQAPSYSDLWGRNVDYTQVINENKII